MTMRTTTMDDDDNEEAVEKEEDTGADEGKEEDDDDDDDDDDDGDDGKGVMDAPIDRFALGEMEGLAAEKREREEKKAKKAMEEEEPQEDARDDDGNLLIPDVELTCDLLPLASVGFDVSLGDTFLGIIEEIDDYTKALLLQLPYARKGYVAKEEFPKALTQILKKNPEKVKMVHLHDYFSIGQYVTCSACGGQMSPKGWPMSLNPLKVNTRLNVSNLKKGVTIYGAVQHSSAASAVIEIKEGLTGVLPASPTIPLKVGQVGYFYVKSIGKDCTKDMVLSIDPSLVVYGTYSDIDLNSTVAGMRVSASVVKSSERGLHVTYCGMFGVVLKSHMPPQMQKKNELSLRVIYSGAKSSQVHFSPLEHIVKLRLYVFPATVQPGSRFPEIPQAPAALTDAQPAIVSSTISPVLVKKNTDAQVAEFIKGYGAVVSSRGDWCTVVQAHHDYLEISLPAAKKKAVAPRAQTLRGIVPRRFTDLKPGTDLSSRFGECKKVQGRVRELSFIDGRAEVSIAARDLAPDFIHQRNVPPGTNVVGTVQKVDNQGIWMKIGNSLNVICKHLHWPPELPAPSKSLGGMTVGARIWAHHLNCIIATCKKELISSPHQVPQRFSDLHPGMVQHGIVTSASSSFTKVHLFQDIVGFAPPPLEGQLSVGTVVECIVQSVDTGKLELQLKQSDVPNKKTESRASKSKVTHNQTELALPTQEESTHTKVKKAPAATKRITEKSAVAKVETTTSNMKKESAPGQTKSSKTKSLTTKKVSFVNKKVPIIASKDRTVITQPGSVKRRKLQVTHVPTQQVEKEAISITATPTEHEVPVGTAEISITVDSTKPSSPIKTPIKPHPPLKEQTQEPQLQREQRQAQSKLNEEQHQEHIQEQPQEQVPTQPEEQRPLQPNNPDEGEAQQNQAQETEQQNNAQPQQEQKQQHDQEQEHNIEQEHSLVFEEPQEETKAKEKEEQEESQELKDQEPNEESPTTPTTDTSPAVDLHQKESEAKQNVVENIPESNPTLRDATMTAAPGQIERGEDQEEQWEKEVGQQQQKMEELELGKVREQRQQEQQNLELEQPREEQSQDSTAQVGTSPNAMTLQQGEEQNNKELVLVPSSAREDECNQELERNQDQEQQREKGLNQEQEIQMEQTSEQEPEPQQYQELEQQKVKEHEGKEQEHGEGKAPDKEPEPRGEQPENQQKSEEPVRVLETMEREQEKEPPTQQGVVVSAPVTRQEPDPEMVTISEVSEQAVEQADKQSQDAGNNQEQVPEQEQEQDQENEPVTQPAPTSTTERERVPSQELEMAAPTEEQEQAPELERDPTLEAVRIEENQDQYQSAAFSEPEQPTDSQQPQQQAQDTQPPLEPAADADAGAVAPPTTQSDQEEKELPDATTPPSSTASSVLGCVNL
ncbi:hypothetical protein Pelo_2652 [Pelomyxa schiedti]|nr:hypothetical protein Pelo_2652 [Pelomyxa schiedti]